MEALVRWTSHLYSTLVARLNVVANDRKWEVPAMIWCGLDTSQYMDMCETDGDDYKTV